jgi:hypothetical protein
MWFCVQMALPLLTVSWAGARIDPLPENDAYTSGGTF